MIHTFKFVILNPIHPPSLPVEFGVTASAVIFKVFYELQFFHL